MSHHSHDHVGQQGGDEEQFKLVVEAHAVLADPQRRQRYDLGEDEDGQMDSANAFGMNGVDIADLFAQFQGGGGPFGNAGSFGGGGGGFRFHTRSQSFGF